MFYLAESSLTWATVWHDAIVLGIGASGTWLTLWLTRKRRSTVKADDRKTGAETEHLEVQTQDSIWEQLNRTRAQVTKILDETAIRNRETEERHAIQMEFLQGQVKMKDEKEYQAHEAEKMVRGRFHAAQHEGERCIFRIRDYEEQLRGLKVEVIPFDFSSYKDLLEGKYKQGKDASTV